ncbi:MAG: DNA methylase [Thermogladius sp.]|nr:DNA methylase [Thermogladius sp.]
MREVSVEEYLDFVSRNRKIVIEDQEIELSPIPITRIEPLKEELTDISTTVWSFPLRGSWATHKGDYRGNWPPQIARALILLYTRAGDLVLDPMAGSGTTCIEAVLLGRNCIAVDINYNAVMLTHHRLYYLVKYLRETGRGVDAWYKVYLGDARDLHALGSESVDLIATHPPYFNIIKYGDYERVEGDLSRSRSLEEYLGWMRSITREFYRVLKPGGHVGILVGDTRVRKHYVPISHYVLDLLLESGFILREEVVKIQHKMKTTREFWSKMRGRDFLLIYHEKLYVLRKPLPSEDVRKLKYSMKLEF